MDIFDAIQPTDVTVPEALAIQISSSVGSNPAEIGAAMGAAFETLMAYLGQHGLQCIGAPRCVYTSYGPEGTTFSTAMPVAAAPENAGDGPVIVAPLPSGKALRFTHTGPYPQLMGTYNSITEYLREKGLLVTDADWAKYMPMWEEYVNDPDTVPEAELITHIYLLMP